MLASQSTRELLSHFTGINVESGTGSGFPASYNLILVDGICLLSDHIRAGQNIELIPVENIGRIELLKGIDSAQYGSDAMGGGVINIITKKCAQQTAADIFSSYGIL